MPAKTRTSRFRDADPQVGRPTTDEVVSADQRDARRRALNYLLFRMMVDEPAQYDALMAEHGLLLDEQDRNDAVMVAVQEDQDWTARWVLAEQDGVVVTRSLHLEARSSATPAGGITTNLLRELSPSAAVSAATAHAPSGVEGVVEKWISVERRRHGPDAIRQGSGRPAVPAHELAEIALAYLEEIGKGSGVTRRVAQRFDMVDETVRDRIRMARARGFLTPTKRGRRGGGKGPALQAIEEQMKGKGGHD